MPPAPEFDAQKFRELIVYVAGKCADDASFGTTKLAKILCWSDFLMYGFEGRAITGATYLRYEYGPFPAQLYQTAGDLVRSGEIQEYEAPYFTRTQRKLMPNRRADLTQFSGEEIALVDQVIDDFRPFNASDVSALSHRELVGWKLAEPFEEIPYSTIFLSADAPTPEDVLWARQVAEAQGLTST